MIDIKRGWNDNLPMLTYLLNAQGAMRSCLAGWQDIFGLANRALHNGGLAPLFQTKIVTLSASNLNRLRAGPLPGLVMAPVMLGTTYPDLANQALLELLARWHGQGVILASACAGSFLLAASGILDGGCATTHWSLAEQFRIRFPKVDLREGELLVTLPADAGKSRGAVYCGGGMTAYVDVALAIIANTGGAALAERVARTLLWDPHRPMQAAYAESTPIPALITDESILRAESWAVARIERDFSLAEWANAIGLELRSFQRRFQTAMSMAPGLWLRRHRLRFSRDLLTTSARSWEEICAACGYRDPGSFRRLFQGEYGLSPREYRQRFGVR